MKPTETIKDYLLAKCGVDAVGIAPVSAFADEPEGHRPEDVMPGAKSVIVFTKRIPDGAIQAALRYHEDGNQDALSVYGAYGCDLTPNMNLFFVEFNLCEFIERHFGYTGAPVPCGPNQNITPWNVPLPSFIGPKKMDYIIHPDRAAVAAGLGELGWNNLLITPENGPRQQIGLIVTSMELDCDAPYDGPRLCDPASCHVCSGVCPMHAIPEAGEADEFTIAGKKASCAHIEQNACAVASLGLRSEFTVKGKGADLLMSDHPTDEELQEAYDAKPASANTLDHYPKHTCNKCLLYCPAGNWKERFGDKGLSRFDGKECA
ncbi:MAG TPA: hypothetical protein IAC12_07855 [Candidatus Aphodovivens avistercoris]|nr:hypothetical protein [Candidatus Aphodovivens avistercoris]